MAITGISAISGEQLIAAGALSAKSAGRAVATTAGDSLQGLYNTVSNNSASWTGGGGGDYVPLSANSQTVNIDLGGKDGKWVITGFGPAATTFQYNYFGAYIESQNHAGHPEYNWRIGPNYIRGGDPSDPSWLLSSNCVKGNGWIYGTAEYNRLVPSSTTADDGKVLAVNGAGVPEWQTGVDIDPFPASITTGSTEVAVVTTGFQDNTATRPTLFISGTTATNNYPRMLLSENHAAAQTSKSGAFLTDAFEFYTGKNGGSTKVLRIDSTGMSGNAGFLFNKAHYDLWNKYSAESGNYYTTANPSGFITAVPVGTMNESNFAYDASDNITAYNGSAFKAGDEFPQSATEAIETVTANSGDWNSTTDTVSGNSATWGGAALPISGGPGIKFSIIDNTLVAQSDETVLWSGASTAEITLSEDSNNFERVRVLYRINDGICGSTEVIPDAAGVKVSMNTMAYYSDKVRLKGTFATLSGIKMTPNGTIGRMNGTAGGSVEVATEQNTFTAVEVIGINRKAGA